MIVEIECIAQPLGTAERPYAHVEAALEVIRASGLHHEVEALGTTIEGEPDQLWALVRRVHEACLASGADSIISVVKLAQSRVAEVSMDDLTGGWR